MSTTQKAGTSGPGSSGGGGGGGAGASAGEASNKKRARYTSVACNECKRRKIKCNGERPCERCGNQGLDCIYASHDFQDSDEYRRMATQIDRLQDQVSELFSMVAQLRQELVDRSMNDGVGGATTVTGGGGAPGMMSEPIVQLGAGDLHEIPDLGMADSSCGPGVGGGGGGDRGGSGGIVGLESCNTMDVDMSRNGRIEFVEHVDNVPCERRDPLFAMSRRDVTRLLSIYTTQIHPIYPLIHTDDVLWRLDMLYQFRDASQRTGLQELLANSEEETDGAGGAPPGIEDDAALVIKMVMAVSANSESLMASPVGERMYNNVQDVYRRKGYPPPPPPAEDDEGEATTLARQRRWIENGLRLRLLQALWHFQHGHDEHVMLEAGEARRAFERELQSGKFAGAEATHYIRLGETVYSMYWLFAVLVKPPPRMDFSIDKRPPVQLPDDFAQDSEGTLRGPLFEYAKLCALVAFSFEGTEESQQILEMVQPPWTKDSAIDFVHRWQTHFADGLRSLSTIRPGMLSTKSPQERVVQSTVYLLANYLRLLVCQYKVGGTDLRHAAAPAPAPAPAYSQHSQHSQYSPPAASSSSSSAVSASTLGTAVPSPSSGGGTPNTNITSTSTFNSGNSNSGNNSGSDNNNNNNKTSTTTTTTTTPHAATATGYNGATAEYLGSARFAQDSLAVLWNVHRTGASWHVHLQLYNRFLAQAAEWLVGMLAGRALVLAPDVRAALERALAMLDTYAAAWPRAGAVLLRLRESRAAGVLGEAL